MLAPPNANNENNELNYEYIEEKIKTIIEKYLADRDYISNKVDIWKESILKEIEKFLSNYNNYKFGIRIKILNKKIKNGDKIKESGFYKNKNYIKNIDIEFKNNKIYCDVLIIIYKKNNKNKSTDLDLNEKMKIIEKDFINFIYGRNYETVKSKYLEMFCKNFFDETLKNLKNGLHYCIEFSNKFYECTRGMMIINKEESDLSEEKYFKNEDESILYVGISKFY